MGIPSPIPTSVPMLQVQALTVAHGDRVVLHDISFDLAAGEVLVVLGASGSGKSSLLRDLIGLQTPAAGRVLVEGQDLYDGEEAALQRLRRRFGVMFQAGALWSAMTVGENMMLPMKMFSPRNRAQCRQHALEKLALVGLEAAFDLMPAELSGGMRKRAALARALALDPPLLFLDEPGSGLDPVNVARLDALILQLRGQLGTAVVMITHDIDSAFAVADRVLFLDEEKKTMTALDTPHALLRAGPQRVREFMQRGREPVPLPAALSTALFSAPTPEVTP